MALTIPKEPKTHTTIYDNFKGVDYTNDASNVYRRRSPSGLNMLPDMDGRPRKRTGWGISIPASAFVRAAIADYDATATYDEGDYAFYDDVLYQCNTTISTPEAWDSDHWDEATITVTSERIHYFSYGGNDFLMIFNSLGVFYMRDDQTTPTKCQMWDESLTPPAAADFPPVQTVDVDGTPTQVVIPADANRAFFFEGNGTAGFYTFVDRDLYRFGADSNGDLYFFKVSPFVPTYLIGANPTTGAGTVNESINMLTGYRTIEYFGDGAENDYKLPSAVTTQTEVTVQILNTVTGEWDNIAPNDATYPWSISDNTDTLTFSGGVPPASTVGNVRITYQPSSGATYTLTTGVDTGNASAYAERVTKQYRHVDDIDVYRWDFYTASWIYDRTDHEETNWTVYSDVYNTAPVQLQVPGLFQQETLAIKANYTGSDATQAAANYNVTFGAYTQDATVTFEPIKATIANTYGTSTTIYEPDVKTNEYTDNWGTFPNMGKSVHHVYRQTRTTTKKKTFTVHGEYTKATVNDPNPNAGADAFKNCQKVLGFGNNIYSQVFMSATETRDFRNRAWYSAANNPAYFPDTNYIEVGSDDRAIMGLAKIGSYLGLVKKGSGIDTSIYLAYPTSFDEDTTFAVKQGIAGIGAISTGAFNVLNEEPLFLSDQGVMGITITEEKARNRSYFVNGALSKEDNLPGAISFTYDGMYWLAVNGKCYVLDGAQKSSWANEKTNLQYECYVLDNIPANCFAKMKNTLFFTDNKGNVCRMKSADEENAYTDEYASSADWVSSSAPSSNEIAITDLTGAGDPKVNQTVVYGDEYYTIIAVGETKVTVAAGVPIAAEWSTIADDDGAVQFFKNLTKKGFVVSVLPDMTANVGVYLKADENEPIFLGNFQVTETTLPYDIFGKKKVKKYKRLQIICRNQGYNEAFAIDQIVKTYTVGNYSKNRR